MLSLFFFDRNNPQIHLICQHLEHVKVVTKHGNGAPFSEMPKDGVQRDPAPRELTDAPIF